MDMLSAYTAAARQRSTLDWALGSWTPCLWPSTVLPDDTEGERHLVQREMLWSVEHGAECILQA